MFGSGVLELCSHSGTYSQLGILLHAHKCIDRYARCLAVWLSVDVHALSKFSSKQTINSFSNENNQFLFNISSSGIKPPWTPVRVAFWFLSYGNMVEISSPDSALYGL